MEKFILTKPELMVLILNVQSAIGKGERVCLCDKSDICFTCETIKVLKRISKETGVPISMPQVRKPIPQPDITAQIAAPL